jgi:hypothetical protein
MKNNLINEFHKLTMIKNENGNVELTRNDIVTLQKLGNIIHQQVRAEKFHSPELQALIAYIENIYFLK